VRECSGQRQARTGPKSKRPEKSQQTQRYLNVTDEELRRGLDVSWNNKADRFDSLQEHEMVNRYEEDDQPNALSVFVTPDVRGGRHLVAETGFERTLSG
jgi:hypothetical protein